MWKGRPRKEWREQLNEYLRIYWFQNLYKRQMFMKKMTVVVCVEIGMYSAIIGSI